MTTYLSRRAFLAAGPVVGLASASAALPNDRSEWPPATEAAGSAVQDPARLYEMFPSQPPALVREMVGVSHGNLGRVKELVGLHPSLARATWDCGFGDWESALGAASHTGRREIAEFLIANGARPTLFSATMLGQLDVVRAFVEASPGVQRIAGPHGITLLAHARFGGEAAAAVLEYLESLGDADERPPTQTLTEEQLALLVGSYTFGAEGADRIVVATND